MLVLQSNFSKNKPLNFSNKGACARCADAGSAFGYEILIKIIYEIYIYILSFGVCLKYIEHKSVLLRMLVMGYKFMT